MKGQPGFTSRANRCRRFSRRDFLKLGGAAGLGLFLAACGSNNAPDDAFADPTEGDSFGQDVDVVVVGAGIAGLTAAYLLQEYAVVVLERGERVGGRAVSGTYQGFTYAKGAEYLGKPYGALAQIIRSLDVELVEIPSPMDGCFYDGHFYYGESGLALMHIEHGSLEEYNAFVAAIQEHYGDYENVPDFNLHSRLAELDEITAEDWFDDNDLSDIFYNTYNVAARGLFGANMDEISALSYIPEIAFDYEDVDPIEDEEDLEDAPVRGQETGAYTFRTGITELTDALAAELGHRIRLQALVTGVARQGEGYLVTYTDAAGQTHRLNTDVVILAVPAPVALRIAPGVLDAEQQEIMSQVSYAPYITAALFSEEPMFDRAFDLAVPDGYFFTDIYDSTWVQRFYDPALADKAAWVAGVYVAPHSYQDQDLLQLSDERILERIYADLERVIPGARAQVVGYDLQRFPYAYPVMTLGAYTRLTRLHRITQGGLLLAGDYMTYPTFEAAAQSGYLAAEKAWEVLE